MIVGSSIAASSVSLVRRQARPRDGAEPVAREQHDRPGEAFLLQFLRVAHIGRCEHVARLAVLKTLAQQAGRAEHRDRRAARRRR